MNLRHPEMGTKNLVRCSQLNMTFNQVECSEKQTEWPKEQHGPLAQLVEQRTFNPRVAGSSPARLTRKGSTNALGQNNHLYPLLTYQPGQAWPAGFLLSFLCGWGYNIIIDDADETLPVVNPLALRGTIVSPNNAKEILFSLTAPSTPPKCVAEVVS